MNYRKPFPRTTIQKLVVQIVYRAPGELSLETIHRIVNEMLWADIVLRLKVALEKRAPHVGKLPVTENS